MPRHAPVHCRKVDTDFRCPSGCLRDSVLRCGTRGPRMPRRAPLASAPPKPRGRGLPPAKAVSRTAYARSATATVQSRPAPLFRRWVGDEVRKATVDVRVFGPDFRIEAGRQPRLQLPRRESGNSRVVLRRARPFRFLADTARIEVPVIVREVAGIVVATDEAAPYSAGNALHPPHRPGGRDRGRGVVCVLARAGEPARIAAARDRDRARGVAVLDRRSVIPDNSTGPPSAVCRNPARCEGLIDPARAGET